MNSSKPSVPSKKAKGNVRGKRRQIELEESVAPDEREAVFEPEVVDDDAEPFAEPGDDDAEIIDADDYGALGEDDEEPRGGGLMVRPDFESMEHEEEGLVPVAVDKGVVVSTALQRYLAELRKYPLMTPEEEREVALRAFEDGDVSAKQRLVTANLRLVVKIAMEYRRAYSQILDLIQEGNAGLVQAVHRFNPYRGVKLSTYSAWWIRAYILKFLMDNKSLVRMGTTDAQRKLFFRLRSEAERLYAQTQRFDARLLAENIGVKESDVVEMQQRLTKHDVSLDSPLSEDGDARQVDTLVESPTAAHFEPADANVERNQLLRILRDEIRGIEEELSERDLFIFRHRILADDPITLHDVGVKFGITRERARQLEARVMKKIRERMENRGIMR